MYKLLATAVVAATFGSTVGYWAHRTSAYTCQGVDPYVVCTTRGLTPRWEMWMDKDSIDVIRGGKTPIFSCYIRKSPARCIDFR